VIEPKDSNRLRLKKSNDTISKEFVDDNRNPWNSGMECFRFCVIGVICEREFVEYLKGRYDFKGRGNFASACPLYRMMSV